MCQLLNALNVKLIRPSRAVRLLQLWFFINLVSADYERPIKFLLLFTLFLVESNCMVKHSSWFLTAFDVALEVLNNLVEGWLGLNRNNTFILNPIHIYWLGNVPRFQCWCLWKDHLDRTLVTIATYVWFVVFRQLIKCKLLVEVARAKHFCRVPHVLLRVPSKNNSCIVKGLV